MLKYITILFISLTLFTYQLLITDINPQDIQNIAQNDIMCIQDLALFHGTKSCVRIVIATDKSLKLLVKYGQEMCFMDGTFAMVEYKMQTVIVVVRHPNGKVSC